MAVQPTIEIGENGMETPAAGGVRDERATAVVAEAKSIGGAALETLKWMFSFPAMLGTLLVGWTFCVLRGFFVDPDVWWHIRVGQDILRTHHWPTTDPYSFTATGTPWIAYEWLGDVVLARVATMRGLPGLFGFLFVTAVMVVLGLFYFVTLRCGKSKAGFLTAVLMSTLALISMTLRPQMIGYLFLIVLLIVLEWFRKGRIWPLWGVPVLFSVWVNVHGSFVVGLGVLCIYLICGIKGFQLGGIEAVAWSPKQRVQLESAILLSVIALAITPYGTQLAAYPLDMMLHQPLNVSNISEWQVMPFDTLGGKLFLLVTVLMVALQVIFRHRWRAEEVLLAVLGASAACLHFRMLLLFVPFAAPLLGTMIARWVEPYKRQRDLVLANALIMAIIFGAMFHYMPSGVFLEEQISKSFPVAAVKFLDSHDVPEPMLNSYGFGGYLIGSGRKVFIDGRGDLFERSNVLGDMITIAQIKPGALRQLDKYAIRSCLLARSEPLTEVLGASPAWKRVYQDETATIFVRRGVND
jgi:hypothetical protein